MTCRLSRAYVLANKDTSKSAVRHIVRAAPCLNSGPMLKRGSQIDCEWAALYTDSLDGYLQAAAPQPRLERQGASDLQMRMTFRDRVRHSLDVGLILALLLSLFNIVPLASNPGVPNSADLPHHSIRVEEMQRSWEHGMSAPNWVDVIYLADGSLVYHIEASLTYYLTSTLHFLLGLGALDATRWLLLLSLLTASGGMYLFCKRRSGSLGALIAGLLYVYSPNLMYTDAYARGAYPELLAYALFPLLLWQIDALRDKAKWTSFLCVFLLQAALFQAQMVLAFVLTAVAIAWLLFETAVQRFNREASQVDARSALLALLAVLLGILGAAGIWLPIHLESDTLHLETPRDARQLDSSAEFVQLEMLLSPAPANDAGAINGLRPLRILGAAQWIAALTGAIGAGLLYIRGCRTRHPQAFLGAAFFSLLSLALMFLTTAASQGIWLSLLPLQYLGYPGRLLGPLAFCLAMVGSMNGIWLKGITRRYRIGAVALAVALPIVTILPLLFVPEWRHETLDISLVATHAEESAARPAGATFADSFPAPAAHTASTRTVALVAAGISLIALLLARWFLRNRRQTTPPYWTVPTLSRTSLIGIALGGGIALLTFSFTFREGIAWLNSPAGEALPAQIQRKYNLDDSLQLLGYDISRERMRPGETLTVNLYWYALAETEDDFSSFLHLAAAGPPLAQVHKLHPGGRAVSQWWSPAGYIFDSYLIKLPRDLPAGDYQLIAGLYTCAQPPSDVCGDGYRPTVRDEDGNLIGESITLGAIRVEDG
jgi:hypothetical protein